MFGLYHVWHLLVKAVWPSLRLKSGIQADIIRALKLLLVGQAGCICNLCIFMLWWSSVYYNISLYYCRVGCVSLHGYLYRQRKRCTDYRTDRPISSLQIADPHHKHPFAEEYICWVLCVWETFLYLTCSFTATSHTHLERRRQVSFRVWARCLLYSSRLCLNSRLAQTCWNCWLKGSHIDELSRCNMSCKFRKLTKPCFWLCVAPTNSFWSVLMLDISNWSLFSTLTAMHYILDVKIIFSNAALQRYNYWST